MARAFSRAVPGSPCMSLLPALPADNAHVDSAIPAMSEESEELMPSLDVRWLRPQIASAVLELPTAPVATSSQRNLQWLAFTGPESSECEDAWKRLSDEEKHIAEEETTGTPKEPVDVDDDEDDIVGVSIAKDKLFEVDVRTMQVCAMIYLLLLIALSFSETSFVQYTGR